MYVTTGSYNDPSGQIYGQLGSGLGTGIGTYFGGPVGGAVGGALGGSVGSLLGGGKKKQKAQIFPVGTKENPGWPLHGASNVLGANQLNDQLGAGDTSPFAQAAQSGLEGYGSGLGDLTTQQVVDQLGAWLRKMKLGGGQGLRVDPAGAMDWSSLGAGDFGGGLGSITGSQIMF